MEILRMSPMAFGYLRWPLRPGSFALVLAIKATFDLRHRGYARLAPQQRACSGPRHHLSDPYKSIRLPSDYALLKPGGLFLFNDPVLGNPYLYS